MYIDESRITRPSRQLRKKKASPMIFFATANPVCVGDYKNNDSYQAKQAIRHTTPHPVSISLKSYMNKSKRNNR
jgi:hypothetical protein